MLDGGSWDKSPTMQHWQDIAWRVQDDTENVLLARARWLRETTGAKNLCVAGGVALNCVANGKILRDGGFRQLWVQPAAGDAAAPADVEALRPKHGRSPAGG